MHAPSPSHILRVHAARVSVVSFSQDNERLYSGDLSGSIAVTSTRTLRPIASWKAHTDGILGVQEWTSNIVTHGRDNKLHVWTRVLALHAVGDAASSPDLPTPTLCYSLDVNALNFCRFSLLAGLSSEPRSSAFPLGESALIAVPNLVESSLADVWELPSCTRVHAAVGKLEAPEMKMEGWQPEGDGRGKTKTGILMSLQLFLKSEGLHLLSGYESGEVILRRYTGDRERSIEGRGWESVWRTRQHNESVMAMAVSVDCSFGLTVSADHNVVRYDLSAEEGDEQRFCKHRIKQAGNGCIGLRSDGRVCAIGGWDGKIRLFSTKSFKSLGTLSYHTKSCQALAFAFHFVQSPHGGDVRDDDELTEEEMETRGRWLAAGSQDQRLTLWELTDFSKSKQSERA